MEGRIRRTLAGIGVPLALTALTALPLAGCGNDAPPMGEAVNNRDSLPVMVTYGVSKLISDSGVVRYKIIAEEWRSFDKTTPPRQEFPKGIFLQRYNENFTPDLYITADTAYCYNQNLWELRGRVFVKNFANGTTFSTQKLFWDMGRHEVYSDVYMHIITPDRDLDGNWFRSNEAMTQYHIRQTAGFMPMPSESGIAGSGGGTAAVKDTASTDTVPTMVRPREMPVSKSASAGRQP